MGNRILGMLGLLGGSLLFSSVASADPKVALDARLAMPVMKGGETQKNYLRVALQGCKPEPNQTRTPVNVAFVIDRSGSMEGERIAQARAAATMAVNRLNSRDIASVVVFDNVADVLMQAQPVHDPAVFDNAIRQIWARGSTAIHAGVLLGASEVRRYHEPGRLNRVVLLSDGGANIGPSKPADFALLGAALLSQGISVSTIGLGLGYNEDLMTKLAYASDGNHAFVERSDQLVSIFDKEFGDVLSVVAQELVIKIRLEPGFRPIRTLGRESEISGDQVTIRLNQIYGGQEKYVVLELDPAKDIGLGDRKVAQVEVSYNGMASGKLTHLDVPVRARFTQDVADAEKYIDKKIMSDVTVQLANEINEEAVLLRDAGRIDDAKASMARSVNVLKEAAKKFDAPALAASADAVEADANKLEDEAGWNQTRKALRAKQHKEKVQQAF